MIKLNLACCDLPLKGWINIDISTSPHIKADLVADVLDLSEHFEKDSVDEIYIGHGVEHLTPDEAKSAVAHWYSLLKPGGILGITTPDFRKIAEGYLSGDPDFSVDNLNWTYIFSYRQESVHRQVCDLTSLSKLLSDAGFTSIEEGDRLHDPRLPFGVPWQVLVQGVK